MLGCSGSVVGPDSPASGYLLRAPDTPPLVMDFGGGVLGPVPPGTYEIDATKAGRTSSSFLGPYFKFNSTIDVAAGVLSLQELLLVHP